MKGTVGLLCHHGRGVSILFCLCAVALLHMLHLPYGGMGTGYAEPVFSITSMDEPLNRVLGKICKATNYQIWITNGYNNKLLTIHLHKTTLEEGIKAIMRSIGGPNYALVIDDPRKKVEIRIFESSPNSSATSSRPMELTQRKTEVSPDLGSVKTEQQEDKETKALPKPDLMAERDSMKQKMERKRAASPIMEPPKFKSRNWSP